MAVSDLQLPENVVVSRLDALANWCRKNSLWPMPFATACCGIELMATGASKHDLARFGAEVFRFSPRQCDLMIVAGRVVMKMLPVLQRIWLQMHEPKWCISMGACASTGGVFDTYAVVQGIDRFIPSTCTCPAARRGPSS
jgi:NADH-quinone oxidoreductase subunit B